MGIDCNFSGGHNRCRYATDELSKYFEYVSFCPEDTLWGHPRESIRLVRDGEIKVIGNKTKEEYTQSLQDISMQFVKELQESDVSGYIFKSKSPTCGIDAIKVYLKNGMPACESSAGIFAKAVMEKIAYLPVIDEGRLNDEWLTENFIMQVFAYKAWQNFEPESTKMADLVEFHTKYKFLLQAKSEKNYRLLGNVVANRSGGDFSETKREYGLLFLETIAIKNRVKPIINVLQHMMGFLKEQLTSEEKEELLESFEEFKKKIIPLIVPLKLLEHHINKHDVKYLKNQMFLNPYPKELGLRSDINAYK